MPRKGAVGEIGRLAGDVPWHVRPLQALSELLEVVVAFVGEIFLREADHVFHLRPALRELARAADSTALMIGS